MGKLQHSVQKKQHRERAQVQERSKYGLLEKHKDYVKRARDYHKKQDVLKVLRSKARERNPDEFYHGMHSRKIGADGLLEQSRRGTGSASGSDSLSMDQVKLLKTQDSNYVRTMRLLELRKGEKKLQEQQAALAFKSAGKHTVFVEDPAALDTFDPAEYFDTTPELLERRENRVRRDQLVTNAAALPNEHPHTTGKRSLKRLKAVTRHMDRERQLAVVEHHMNVQREVMKRGAKKKIQDAATGQVHYKWKKQRKR